jgi:ribosomal protein L27
MWSFGSVALTILAGAIVWYAFRQTRHHRIDSRYGCKVSGGRAGEIRIRFQGRDAVAQYEVGAGVDLLVYASSLAWAGGERIAPEQRTQLIALLSEWSKKRGTSLDIAADA